METYIIGYVEIESVEDWIEVNVYIPEPPVGGGVILHRSLVV